MSSMRKFNKNGNGRIHQYYENDFEVDALYFDEWLYMNHKILARIDNDYTHIYDFIY